MRMKLRETGRRKKILAFGILSLVLAIFLSVFFLFYSRDGSAPIAEQPNRPTTLSKIDELYFISEMHGPESPFIDRHGEIFSNDSFIDAMSRIGLDAVAVEDITGKMRGVYNFNKCRPGDTFDVRSDTKGKLQRFEYHSSPIEVYVLEKGTEGKFVAYKEEFEEEKRIEWIAGRIDSSLYESVISLGEEDTLSMMIANEVFAWDIDFYTEAQKGDVFKVAVEKYYSGNYFIKYGRILAAEYSGGVGFKQAFLWTDPTGKDGYFNAQGIATRRVFLRSPLKYAHVTSSFGKRFHPIFHQVRMHSGVDYGAPTGTPVWAIADGTVSAAGYRGGIGNAVTIKHSSGYNSTYGHLSRIAPRVRSGVRIKQGMVIGFVGSTGLSTGPHLHFSLQQNGIFINPQKKVTPPTQPIEARYLNDFKASIKPWITMLGEVKGIGVKIIPSTVGSEDNAPKGVQRIGQGS